MCGDDELAEAEATVAGWHLSVGEDGQALCGERLIEAARQHAVLENAAAEADARETGAMRGAKDGFGEDGGETGVEAAAHDTGSNAAAEIVGEEVEEWFGFDLEAGVLADGERVRAEVVARIAGGLEGDGGLCLLSDVGVAADERGDGVEGAAAA